MNTLRRAVGRKQVIIGMLVLFLCGGWLAWELPAQSVDPQTVPSSGLEATQAGQIATLDMTGQQTRPGSGTLLSTKVAEAAALRQQLDQDSTAASALTKANQIRQVLGPMFQPSDNLPSLQQDPHWRHGLATLVDAGLLAAEAGDATGEGASLAAMQQYCPQEAWGCQFQIPEKALQIARSVPPVTGAIDDHARVAMLTAAGYLYAQAGDRKHGDALLRKAVRAYGRLLETYDGWTGEVTDTITPQGQAKKVGSEFYTYRNRLERLAKYSADYWGRQVVDGRVGMGEALAACDHRLFRALVRVRADRQTDPIVILQQEGIREVDYETVASWFATRPHAPQAEWELQRSQLIGRIGQEEVQTLAAAMQARQFVQQKDYGSALTVLQQSLQTEPALAETGVTLRCETASVLMDQGQYEQALGLLEDADQVLQAGDLRLANRNRGGLQGRIRYYRLQCARGAQDGPRAIQLAEQLAGDTGMPLILRARALADLVQMHIRTSDKAAALDAYSRLVSLPVTPEQSQAFLQALLQVTQSRLSQKGWYTSPPATQG